MIGESNFITANSYYFIADCYAGLNDYDNAVSYCKKSLSIRQQVLGDQSIDYLSSLKEQITNWCMQRTKTEIETLLEDAGVDAVLIGEALMRADNIAQKLHSLRGETA